MTSTLRIAGEAAGPERSSPDAEEWETPCECGSRWVCSTEINDDNPDAIEHEMFFCDGCGKER